MKFNSLSLVILGAIVAEDLQAQITFSATSTTLLSRPFAGSHSPVLATTDFDGDNDVDLLDYALSSPWIGVNDGAGNFTWHSQSEFGFTGDRYVSADIDNDGQPDLVAIDGEFLRWRLNTSNGVSPPTFGPAASFEADSTIYGFVTADFDDDGRVEFAATRAAVGTGVGFAEFIDITGRAGAPVLAAVSSLLNIGALTFVEDLNRDGICDLCLLDGRTFLNQGQSPPAFVAGPTLSTHRTLEVASGDLNGDGRPDIMYGQNPSLSNENGLHAHLNRGVCGASAAQFGSFQSAYPGEFNQVERLGAADFDSDGRDELLLTHAASGVSQFFLHQTNPDGGLTGPTLVADFVTPVPGLNLGIANYGLADVNNDGRIDIVGTHLTNYFVLLNETDPLAARPSEFITEAPWSVPGVRPPFVFVDQASTSSGTPNGSATDPYRTITAAVTNAVAGDVIFVYPGRYNGCSGELNTGILSVQDLELVGVMGPEHTVCEEMVFQLDSSAMRGFTLRSHAVGSIPGDALILSRGAEVVDNVILGDSASHGVIVEGVLTSRVGSNVLHGCATAIIVRDQVGEPTSPSAVIYNNTVVGNETGILFGGTGTVEIVNNIVVDSVNFGILHDCLEGTPSTLLYDYNLVENNPQNYQSLDLIPPAMPLCDDPPALDPLGGPNRIDGSTWDSAVHFVNAATLDFHLATTAPADPANPAIEAGRPDYTPIWLSTDVDGDPRPTGSLPQTGTLPDVGADQLPKLPGFRLQTRSRPLGLDFVTSVTPSGVALLEAKLISSGPDGFPFDVPGPSVWLISLDSHFATIGSTLPAAADSSTLAINWTVGSALGIGARVYVQVVVLDVLADELHFSNATVFTER